MEDKFEDLRKQSKKDKREKKIGEKTKKIKGTNLRVQRFNNGYFFLEKSIEETKWKNHQ